MLLAATPFLGSPFALPTTIQAEDFDNGGEGVGYHDTDAANLGGKYRPTAAVDIEPAGDVGGGFDVGWNHAGEWLNYSINVATTGNFDLTTRIASAVGGGSFHYEVDGVNGTGAIAVPKTGDWQTYTSVTTPAAVHLTAGDHALRLVFDTNDAYGFAGNVNWIRFTSITPPPPPTTTSTPFLGPPANLPGRVELENFDNGGEGVAYHDADAANMGGQYRPIEGVDLEAATDVNAGYALDYTRAGEWVGYSTFIKNTAQYDLSFRVANYGSGGAFHLEVDGVNVTGSLAVPDTGGFQKWATVTRTGVSLNKGLHFVKLVMDGNSQYGFSGNFNWMQISPTVTPPAPTSTPFAGTPALAGAQIEAENYDLGGPGVAFVDSTPTNEGGAYRPTEAVDTQATTDVGGGYNVGWTHAGESLNYTITVPTTGMYTLASRVAAAGGTGGYFHVEFAGVNRTGAIAIPNTGGWQTWQTVNTPGLQLTAGTYVMRVVIDTNGPFAFAGNFNWFKLSLAEAAKNVVFFGNSFTVNNDLPGLVAKVATADKHATPNLVTQATPGWTLADHVNQLSTDGIDNVIQGSLTAANKWDAAVIQEYSTRATSVTAAPINGDAAGFRADAANLIGQIHAHSPKAKAVLFETWARGAANPFYPESYADPAAMQADLQAQYVAAADDANAAFGAGTATVAPVGEGFRALNWSADLYDAADQYHPSGKGSLLAAMILYRSIYNEKVSDILEAKIDATIKALGLTASDWATLQTTADAVA